MTSSTATRRLAVLIDAENLSAGAAEPIATHVRPLGQATVRRAYGDFSNRRLASWEPALSGWAVQPVQVFPAMSGKNSADIALVVDAMDLLHWGVVDGFCLASSDADFTKLAIRIREQGLPVWGLGYAHASQTLQDACTRYIQLGPRKEQPTPQVPAQRSADQKLTQAARIVSTALAEIETTDGWVSLSALGTQLRVNHPRFDPRQYGSAQLSRLLIATGQFDVKAKGGTHYARSKSGTKAA